MPRGIPWDDLPNRYTEGKPKPAPPVSASSEVETMKERDFKSDFFDIGRRCAFGVVCGTITGATFGFVDVLRDPKSMTGKTSVATKKIFRYSYLFAGFFGSYHGVRKSLKLYFPQSAEENVLTSALICVTPLIFISKLRPLIPYGVMLIGLDAINGMNDI
mmetsp:Transcript_12065/g.16510  ORF Transcript_12065/g.16510 Transcript_12065/m.16510 type:complete len:160 (+) Transcript_12065:10-489(+)